MLETLKRKEMHRSPLTTTDFIGH
nr:unnamed protein product [Callosobruchus chinensis]